jgi:hypothetical protein
MVLENTTTKNDYKDWLIFNAYTKISPAQYNPLSNPISLPLISVSITPFRPSK